MWGYSRYNVLVKQVEGCSDILGDVAVSIEPLVGNDRVALSLLKHIQKSVRQLDKTALQMLANYDKQARGLLKSKIYRDPRRNLFKIRNPANGKPTKALPSAGGNA